MQFKPTHEITLTDTRDGVRRTFGVRLHADESGKGPAYTRKEWESHSPADWECDGKYFWFQGGNYPSHTTSVRKLVRADDLTATQREFVENYVADVESDPSSYEKSVRGNPVAAALRVIDGLDDRDVRRMIREHKAELRRIKRLTGR